MKKNSLLSLFNAKNLDSIDNLELMSARDLMLNNVSLSRDVLTTRKWDVNWTVKEGYLVFFNGNKYYLQISIKTDKTVMNDNNGTDWGNEDLSIKDWHNAPRPLKFQVSVDKSGFTIYYNNAVFRTFPNRQGLTDISVIRIRGSDDGIEATEINNEQNNTDSSTTDGGSTTGGSNTDSNSGSNNGSNNSSNNGSNSGSNSGSNNGSNNSSNNGSNSGSNSGSNNGSNGGSSGKTVSISITDFNQMVNDIVVSKSGLNDLGAILAKYIPQ